MRLDAPVDTQKLEQDPRSLEEENLVLRIEFAPNRVAVFDFSVLRLDQTVCRAFMRALTADMGHTSIDTQKRTFQSLRLLSQSLYAAGEQNRTTLPANVAHAFAKWLDSSDLGSSAQWHLRQVVKILKWCQRNVPEVMATKTSLLVHRIRAPQKPKTRVVIDEDTLKQILRACYDDIDRIEAMLSRGSRLKSGEVEDPKDRSDSDLIRDLLTLGKGELPTQYLVNRSGHAYARRVEELGGHRAIGELLWVSPRTLFPFFLAILIQVSGNPEAIREIGRQCVMPHPLRSDLERLVWRKGRSNSDQRAEFPVGRQWSAPNLARRVLALNQELVSRAPQSIRDRLFICRGASQRRIFVLSKFDTGRYLREFIERHELPPFQLKSLRRAGAVLHHLAGQTIDAARKRLNHKSVGTTLRYTDGSDLADLHDSTILQFQGEMIALSLGRTGDFRSEQKGSTESTLQKPAETVFGFACKNPLGGIAPGSKAGQPCPQFTHCATCPGSIVPLDDPVTIARLLEALDALNDAKERSIREGWNSRYELLYEQTRRILTVDIFPAVHPSVIERARALVEYRLVPHLE